MSENVPIMTILDSVCLHAEDADDSKDVSRKLGYLRKRKQNILAEPKGQTEKG